MAKRLSPPNDLDALTWASRYDARPTILPVWPDDNSVVIIAVVKGSDNEGVFTEAYLMCDGSDLRRFSGTDVNAPVLFFRMARAIVSPRITSDDHNNGVNHGE